MLTYLPQFIVHYIRYFQERSKLYGHFNYSLNCFISHPKRDRLVLIEAYPKPDESLCKTNSLCRGKCFYWHWHHHGLIHIILNGFIVFWQGDNFLNCVHSHTKLLAICGIIIIVFYNFLLARSSKQRRRPALAILSSKVMLSRYRKPWTAQGRCQYYENYFLPKSAQHTQFWFRLPRVVCHSSYRNWSILPCLCC